MHRIGRTGRAGVAGTAISFACEDESFTIPAIEKYIGNPLTCSMPDEELLDPVPPPSPEVAQAPLDEPKKAEKRRRRWRNRKSS